MPDTISLPPLHVGRGWRAGSLTLFPVWAEAPSVHGLAVGPRTVSVDERDGSPVVSELVVRNTGTRPALLLEGEMLEGGWQHRALNADLLLEPGDSCVAEVSCVEHGRWQGGSSHVRSSRMSSGSVRAALRTDAGERQHRVWDRVGRFDAAFGQSPTSSLGDHLTRVSREAAHGAVSGGITFGDIPRRPVPGQRGVVVALGGEPAWLEVMPSSGSLSARWRSLVEAALLDAALADPVGTPGQAARDFAVLTSQTRLAWTSSPGSGRAVTGERRALSTRGLARDDGTLIHAMVMNRAHRSLVLT